MLNIKFQGNLLLIPVVALFTACGVSAGPINSERATSLKNTYDYITGTLIAGQEVSSIEDLPSGVVQYSGAFFTYNGEGTSGIDEVLGGYLGELELVVDFDVGTISGEATNFIFIENPDAFKNGDADQVAGVDVTGILTIAGTQSENNSALYDVRAEWHLTVDGSSKNANGNYSGSVVVFGANAEALNIGGEGGATTNGNPGFAGFFGAAQRYGSQWLSRNSELTTTIENVRFGSVYWSRT